MDDADARAASYARSPMDPGILARAKALDGWLHASVVVLTAASAVRYLTAHGLSDRAGWILAGVVLLLGVYAVRPRRGQRLWCLAVIGVWIGLAFLAPSFTWVAVPLAFLVLRHLPLLWAGPTLAVMVVTVITTWSRMRGFLDPTLVAGPVCIALLAVVAYRALEREAQARQELLDELEAAQGDLAAAQHRAGALAERTRLSRDIHDSVAQGLSSINLFLQAAERDWAERPEASRDHVRRAALTARESLDDVRHVVRDLAPAGEATDALEVALRATVARVPALEVAVHVHGDPRPVPAETATALLRSARGALANVAEHSGTATASVSLTFLADEVTLDVRDEGRGFDATATRRPGTRGHGLDGIRSRAAELGGRTAVESEPGEGTVVSVSFPLEES